MSNSDKKYFTFTLGDRRLRMEIAAFRYREIQYNLEEFAQIVKTSSPSLLTATFGSEEETLLMHMCKYALTEVSITKKGIQKIRFLIEAGPQHLGIQNVYGDTALSLICSQPRRDQEVIEMLLDSMTTEQVSIPDRHGDTALMKFVRDYDSKTLLKKLISKTKDALTHTNKYGQNACMMYVKRSAFHRFNREIFQSLFVPELLGHQDNNGETLLMKLCRCYDHETLMMVLNQCSREVRELKDAKGLNAFHHRLMQPTFGASKADRDQQTAILQKSVKEMIPYYDIHEEDNGGNNALMIAHPMHAETLLRNAANPRELLMNVNQDGNNALMRLFTKNGHAESVLRHGRANFDPEEHPWESPPSCDIVKLYLRYGAGDYLHQVNRYGNNVFLIAGIMTFYDNSISKLNFKLLLEAGAFKYVHQRNDLGRNVFRYLLKEHKDFVYSIIENMRMKEAMRVTQTLLQVEKRMDIPLPFDVMMSIASKSTNMNVEQRDSFFKSVYTKKDVFTRKMQKEAALIEEQSKTRAKSSGKSK